MSRPFRSNRERVKSSRGTTKTQPVKRWMYESTPRSNYCSAALAVHGGDGLGEPGRVFLRHVVPRRKAAIAEERGKPLGMDGARLRLVEWVLGGIDHDRRNSDRGLQGDRLLVG